MKPGVMRAALAAASCAVFSACATGLGSVPATSTETPTGAPLAQWPVTTREHIDLWLHGYALLTGDTARVPFFRRGYRQMMRELRSKRGAFTQLDANADQLSARFRVNPALVNGQFVPFYFSSFEQIQQAANLLVQSDGNPGAASDPATQQLLAVLNASYPTAADRDWLRLFVQSLADENARFYQSYWTGEQNARAATRQSVDSVWRVYRPRLQRFLNNTQQLGGEIVLSLPLDGEGRTIAFSKQQTEVGVGFPDSPAGAAEAVYVFAHEMVNAITATAINDNTTPAEQRSGVAARYTANANVRAGAVLLQRAAPDLANGYMRYYLRSAGVAVPAGDPSAVFTASFPIPDAIRDAVTRQIEVVLGGI